MLQQLSEVGCAGVGQHSQDLLGREDILWKRKTKIRETEREIKSVLFDAKGLRKNQVINRSRDACCH